MIDPSPPPSDSPTRPLPPRRISRRSTLRAQPPQLPAPAPTALLRQQKQQRRGAEASRREHFSLLAGMLWTVLALLAASLWRAGSSRGFVHGWWKQW